MLYNEYYTEMKILILNEDSNPLSSTQTATISLLASHLAEQKHQVITMNTSQLKIADCIGCFNCWLKTPGICVIKDDQADLLAKAIHSDLLLMVSPVRKGFITSQLKRSIDRLIPTSLPFFRVKEGQFSHVHRYPKTPDMALLLDYETDNDRANEGVIKAWIERFNWHSDSQLHFVSDLQQMQFVKNYFASITNQ